MLELDPLDNQGISKANFETTCKTTVSRWAYMYPTQPGNGILLHHCTYGAIIRAYGGPYTFRRLKLEYNWNTQL